MKVKENTPAVGIDLGTTFSVLCYLDEKGLPLTVVNAEGDRLTPSVVLFDEEEVIVGKEALKAYVIETDHVAECSKRDVGYRVYHKALAGKHYPPEVIEAFILDKIHRDAVNQIGEFSHVVITVPAYFDEVRRKATQDAGYMAGLDVLDIINEPVAAAISFGHQKGLIVGDALPDHPLRMLVYDLGGGTFDVTVMEVRGTDYTTLAIDGDVHLGGWDWDQRLVDLVAERFIRKHHADPRENSRTAGKLWRECEDAKRTLSARHKAIVPCECEGRIEQVEITREQFEEATQDLLDRTRFTSEQTLKAAGLHWEQIDRVLLVGGSTRMPMIRRMLRELSGKEPDASVAADEAVAQGAAYHAGRILSKAHGRPTTFRIRNVNSHSLGVIGLDPLTKRRRTGVIIPRNTPLPVTAKRTFRTQKANQRSILVEIVEGESPSPDDCSPIGRVTVHSLPPDLAQGWPVEVVFRYKTNGRLKVRVNVPETEAQVDSEFTREIGLPKEHLDGWREYISGKAPGAYR